MRFGPGPCPGRRGYCSQTVLFLDQDDRTAQAVCLSGHRFYLKGFHVLPLLHNEPMGQSKHQHARATWRVKKKRRHG